MPPRLFKKIGYVCIVTIASIGAMVYYSLTVVSACRRTKSLLPLS